MKKYVPVGSFEQQTSHCPTYIAWRILDEVRDGFRPDIPDAYADLLAARAERVFAKHPFWQQKYKSARGREYLLSFMRHWLSSVLARERPALFRRLPDDFKNGAPLPWRKVKRVRPPRGARLVHGGELLAF